MASQLISCGRHGMVYRCDDDLSAPVDALVRVAPAQLQAKLLLRTEPWCLKVLRSSARHIAYLEQVFSRIDAEPVMPSVIGFWRVEAENGEADGAGDVSRDADASPTATEAYGVANAAADTESADREAVLVMAADWVEGPSLADYLAQLMGLLDEDEAAVEIATASAVAALAALAKAILSMQSCGTPFVHGDIKPANVIVVSASGAMEGECAGRKAESSATANVESPQASATRPNALRVALVDFDTVSLLSFPRGFSLPATRGFSAPECMQPGFASAAGETAPGAAAPTASASAAAADLAPAPSSAGNLAVPTQLATLTPAADIYSFGACVQATLAALANRPLPDAPWVKQLETLASACMAPDPEKRPSAIEAEQAVRRIEDQFSEILVTPPRNVRAEKC